MGKQQRIRGYLRQSMNRAALGLLMDWQEWFGGFYWVQIELWFAVWYMGIEITNRPPDPDEDH